MIIIIQLLFACLKDLNKPHLIPIDKILSLFFVIVEPSSTYIILGNKQLMLTK